MRIFCASIATETNTFSPLRTDMSDFRESFYAAPGEHPETPTLCSAVFTVARARAKAEGWELVEGTATWAEPGGLVNRETYETLRDEVLGQLRAAMPVDGVVLGLHGAMVAQDYLDCEGDLLQSVRDIVGPDVVIGASFDPHSHLSAKRFAAADIFVAFKEFPHTDFVEAGAATVDLVLRTIRGEIKPVKAAFDCKMIEVLPTSREPMRSFVDRMKAMEGKDGVLSVSVIHGFMAGDVPEIGSHVIVITDNDAIKAEGLSHDLGMELFGFRGTTRPDFITPEQAMAKLPGLSNFPVVIADVWDNPGGGVPGDSTLLLRKVMEAGLKDYAFGTIWDPMAVRICFSAGEGGQLPLRFGGKTSSHGGAPVDAMVTVKKLRRNSWQSFGDSIVPLGDCALIELPDGGEVILNSNRAQSFDPDLFSNMGVDPTGKKYLFIKSTNHFYDAFAKIAGEIVYVNVHGPYPSDPKTNGYKHLTRKVWPIVDDPFALAS
ncbi:M81 family metallopeptidase [Thalassospira marina]|uniref:Microcystinase C n=1 Tax=Thalassospira marina TaxID=2048283 RepID=A0ABN5FFA8_9PROT|nr:M81 family metallopeptidase [Thalassospira marina]AUG53135.1 microcystin LR degradation protein MlrC-like protein [Thalassospira marina]